MSICAAPNLAHCTPFRIHDCLSHPALTAKEDRAAGDALRTVVQAYRLLCCGIGTSSCPKTYLVSASKGGEQLTNVSGLCWWTRTMSNSNFLSSALLNSEKHVIEEREGAGDPALSARLTNWATHASPSDSERWLRRFPSSASVTVGSDVATVDKPQIR